MLLALLQQQLPKTTAWSHDNTIHRKIAVIGGGASGMFAAIAAGEEWLRCYNNNHNNNRQSPTTTLQLSSSTTKAASNNVPTAPTTPSPHRRRLTIHVLEATRNTLTKVKNSGGGRCNVLHDTCKSIPDLLAGYPRGQRELQGIFHKRFTPQHAQLWFEQHGVSLKTESDGRMFPTTDSSQTIVDALLQAARNTGIVQIDTKRIVKDLKRQQQEETECCCDSRITTRDDDDGRCGWMISSSSSGLADAATQEIDLYDAVILATGSSPTGYRLASNVGLELVSPVPSLFTLSTEQMVKPGGLFHGLSGVSVPWARIYLELPVPPPPSPEVAVTTTAAATTTTNDSPTATSISKKARSNQRSSSSRSNKSNKPVRLEQEGPLLITHHGLSGPAALRLSAFAANDLHDLNYRTTLHVHWAPTIGDTPADIFQELITTIKMQWAKKFVASTCPWRQPQQQTQQQQSIIPKRLWSALVQAAGIEESITWSQVSNAALQELSRYIAACPIYMTGKSRFADEFVTAGGIDLKQIDMTKMQSKLHSGLFVCGEICNVDGITGGYNFMNCWSTGYVAGCAAVHYVLNDEYAFDHQQRLQSA